MQLSAIKIVPTAVILVASASATWPYVELEGASAQAPSSLKAAASAKSGPEIAAALLHPTIAPRPLRDPFIDADALQAEAKIKLGKLMKGLLDEHRKRAKEQTLSKHPAVRGAVKGANAATESEADPAAGLVLNGTVASGSRGIAMINGKSYMTGEPVSEPGTVDPVILEEVLRDQIVLRHKGRKFPLTYVVRSTRDGAGDSRDAGPPRSAPAKKAGTARGKSSPTKPGASKKS
jgi:hypothetical protein